MRVHRTKPRKDALEYTSGGKPTEVAEGIAEVTETERVGPRSEVDLLPTEKERVDDHDRDLLGLKSGSETQGTAMLDKEDNTPTL